MGCSHSSRTRGLASRAHQVAPEPVVPSAAAPAKQDAFSADQPDKAKLASVAAELEEALATAEVADDPEEDDGGETSDSSEANGNHSPEHQWMKQARRQARQERRRRRAARDAQAMAMAGRVPAWSASSLDDNYTIEIRLSCGTFSTVSRCTHVKTQHRRALKTIEKRKSPSTAQIQQEIAIMRSLTEYHHPNIVGFYDAFEDSKSFHIVMELCSGGELYASIVRQGSAGFTPSVAATITRQVTAAIHFLHSRHIAHRDVKAENFMMADEHRDVTETSVKMIDFGFSRRFVPGEYMKTMAFTSTHVAPEVLAGKYTEAGDVWSLGVIAYAVLCSVLPFRGENDEELFSKIKAANYNFDLPKWETVGEEAKDFVRRLLVVDANQRLSAEQALHHPWVDPEIPSVS